ncbi:trypsin-like peptidase domain-containing protein [Streptomyces sp. NPDC102405]|uniref:trypsin-like peptidase domain-containing protein n=1 Tax=Streptomyces sp. NPDC102405 TaxID=3366170 RepID=UPI003814DBA3
MEERRRVALVEAAGQGSGYVLGPRLVLTAGHVLGALDHAVVRTPRGVSVRCQVVWARSDGPYDAALLLAEDDLVSDPDPVRWGTLVTSDPSEVSILGFSALAGREGRVGSGVFRGSADPLEAVETDRYVLDLAGNPPLGPADSSPWAGMSGGAVWCHGVLIGIAVADLPGWPHSRLEAVPAYVLLADAGFRELVQQHTERGVQLEPAEFADGAEAAAPLVPRSVASLLHPRAETVRFSGRRELLTEMTEWSTKGDGVSLALLTGAGGAGKSRIARELGHRLTAMRYAIVHLTRNENAHHHRMLARTTAPVLLVVDYGESRVEQVRSLLDELVRRPRGIPFRVLLIARSVGHWWDEVRESRPEAAELAERARHWSITGTESLGMDAREAFRTAVTDLARGVAELGLPTPVSSSTDTELRRPLRTVLEIHMAALASLLAPHAATTVRDAQDTLLRHEAAYWRKTSQKAPLDSLGDSALRNAVVTATLVGPVSRDRAHALLMRVPRLGDQPEAARRAVADWLRDLYPRLESGDGGTWQWGTLEPDPLGEYLVGTQVVREPEIFLRLIEELGNEEMANALLVLSRAAAWTDGLSDVLRMAVRTSPAMLAPRLVSAATRSAEPALLIDALDVILEEGLLLPEQMIELAQRTPVLTQALADWSVRLVSRLTEIVEDRSADDPVERAGALFNLTTRLLAAKRREEGLATATSALGLLDTAPIATAPAGLRGMLLDQRTQALYALERAEESVVEGEQALLELSGWQTEDPDESTAFLAGVLNNLSYGLAATGRLDEALDKAQASVNMRRELVSRNAEVRPDLARSLNTLSRHHLRAGNLDAALTAARESLHVRRAAAEDRPDAFLTELESTLSHLAEILIAIGDFTGAREVFREAASVRRQLDPSHQGARQQDYVGTLLELAELSRAADAPEAAMEIADEAVTLARRLVVEQGRDYLPLLGAAFITQAVALGATSRRAVAIRVNTKAAQIFRSVHRDMPDSAEALLEVLDTLVRFLLLEHRPEDAERVAAEAVAVLAFMELPEDLADAHMRHAQVLLLLDRLPEFESARRAALELYQRLNSESPGGYAQKIAEAQVLGLEPPESVSR